MNRKTRQSEEIEIDAAWPHHSLAILQGRAPITKHPSGSTCYKCQGQDGKTEDGGWIAVRVILSLQGELPSVLAMYL